MNGSGGRGSRVGGETMSSDGQKLGEDQWVVDD